MGRLIDVDSAYTVLTDYYHHKTDAQHMALKDALDKVETVNAIPIDWIESYLSDCAEWSIAYYVIKQMLYEWREEQNNGQTD